jgi:hypothetical protein
MAKDKNSLHRAGRRVRMNPRAATNAAWIRRLAGTGLLMTGALAITVEAPAQQLTAGGLFRNPGVDIQGPAASGGRVILPSQDSPVIVRSRLVDVDFALLGGASTPAVDAAEWRSGTMVEFNLFDDTTVLAMLHEIVRNDSGSYSWVGYVAADPMSSVTLVINDGILVGNVTTSRGTYQIRPTASGHVVHETDQSLYPEELEPIPVEAPVKADAPTVDDGSLIDMLVVYTPAARIAAGGTAAMLNLIDLAITETNAAYASSNITPRLRLVHAEEVAYTEYGGASAFSNALSELRATADGVIDNVHTLRDTYGADAVQMLISDPTYCGLAYRMVVESAGFASSAFGVTAYNCATGYYSFGHELGHNQGSHHDRYVTGTDSTVFPYSFGYVHVGASAGTSWRTILAYGNLCSDTFGSGCTRVQYFSNPDVNYVDGNPTGVATSSANAASNRLSINNTAVTFANFREAVDAAPAAPTNLAAAAPSGTQIDLSWTDNADNETGFDLWRRQKNGGVWSSWTKQTLAANATSRSVTGLTAGKKYQFKLRATNGSGDSTWVTVIKTTSGPPAAPTNLAATSPNGTKISLTWTDNANNETGFHLWRRQKNGGVWSGWTTQTLAANKTAQTVTGLTAGKKYQFKLRATNASGNSTWAIVIKTTVSPPAAPSGLSATVVSGTKIDLDWTDNANNESGFDLWRRQKNGGVWSGYTKQTLPPNKISKRVAGLTPGKKYQFFLRATNAAGKSVWINVIKSTP